MAGTAGVPPALRSRAGETPAVPEQQPILITHGRQLMSGAVKSETLVPAVLAATIIAFVGEPSAVAQSALPPPAFHHLHLNTVDPDGAIAFYTRQFPSTAKAAWGGMAAL